jgi:hypothetical protein
MSFQRSLTGSVSHAGGSTFSDTPTTTGDVLVVADIQGVDILMGDVAAAEGGYRTVANVVGAFDGRTSASK